MCEIYILWKVGVGVNKRCIACSVRCARGCTVEPCVSEVQGVCGFRLLTSCIGRNEQCVSSLKVKRWNRHRPLLLLNTAAQTALPGAAAQIFLYCFQRLKGRLLWSLSDFSFSHLILALCLQPSSRPLLCWTFSLFKSGSQIHILQKFSQDVSTENRSIRGCEMLISLFWVILSTI